MNRHLGPNLGRGGGLPSTRRKEESSSAARVAANESSPVKSKTESEMLLRRFERLLRLRVQSAIRPSLSEREKGAKGTLTGMVGEESEGFGLVVVDEVASGGPQPSGLKGTKPTSKVEEAIVDDGREKWRNVGFM